ncbi:tetratricopeptide repeat protein [Methylobacterium sp. GC_Met_2]|uniref:tetratricopeptide repeat protein n=1 Tax=Methylobacterium sp. GC_Met_2 TaxID=2937376 RepID=UPI00226B7E3F|nr:tetratricopeptide repeat protein [Methylobacterium sp. GC_Met_2]
MLNQHSKPGGNRIRKSSTPQRIYAEALKCRASGQLDQARESLRRLLQVVPGHPEAHYELGRLALNSMPGEAVGHFVAALRGASDRPAYWLTLATALIGAERVPEARAILEQYLTQDFGSATQQLNETFVEHVFGVAQTHYAAKAFREAEVLLDLVIFFDNTHTRATYLAGAIAAHTNRLDLAYDLMSIAIYREPANALFFSGLGSLLAIRGDAVGAISALEKALELDPDLASAHANIAGVYQGNFRHGEALRHAERAIALDPNDAGAHSNRGSVLLSLGHLTEAIAAFDRALAINPSNVFTASNSLFAKLYADEVTPESYAADAKAFGQRFAAPVLRQRPFANNRDPGRRLRVGFVSADLYNHAVIRFLEPFLKEFDRSAFTTLAYMTRAREDDASTRLRTLFDGWHNISGLDDDEAADCIEADAVDILVDLSGHSAGHRLLVFARKPAPVQVTWIGHPGTTGLDAIDYRLTDADIDPIGFAEALHAERLWRLPRISASCASPSALPPVRACAPFEDNGYVTFGCFNRLTKVADRTLATWAQILDAVPDARLFMVAADIAAPEICAAVEARLRGAGLPLDRVIFHPRLHGPYHQLYYHADVALDPYPYNGGTTSFDTLMMGVPFITLRGQHAAARTGVAVLTALGMPELIADNPDAYVAIARDLAQDRGRLREIRAGLRERMEASPLMDHRGLAADVADAFRAMWCRWLVEDRV